MKGAALPPSAGASLQVLVGQILARRRQDICQFIPTLLGLEEG